MSFVALMTHVCSIAMQQSYSGRCGPRFCRCGVPDEDATEVPVQDRQIGFVFQSYALFKHMTIAENIAFGPRIRQLGIDVEERCANPPLLCNGASCLLAFRAGLPVPCCCPECHTLPMTNDMAAHEMQRNAAR